MVDRGISSRIRRKTMWSLSYELKGRTEVDFPLDFFHYAGIQSERNPNTQVRCLSCKFFSSISPPIFQFFSLLCFCLRLRPTIPAILPISSRFLLFLRLFRRPFSPVRAAFFFRDLSPLVVFASIWKVFPSVGHAHGAKKRFGVLKTRLCYSVMGARLGCSSGVTRVRWRGSFL